MRDLTHVRVNVSPTTERVLTHRQHAALEAATRRGVAPAVDEQPPAKPEQEEDA